MLGNSGQTGTEVLGVAVVALAMLVLVVIAVQGRNSETGAISDSSMSLVQCDAISEVVTSLSNNRATSERTLLVDKNSAIKKNAGMPGMISVGGASCYYTGSVAGEQAGISLSGKIEYKFRKSDGEVSVCEMPC
jgi:hypothetical protein